MTRGLNLFPRPWTWSYPQMSVHIISGVLLSVIGGSVGGLLGGGLGLWGGLPEGSSWIEIALLGVLVPFLLTGWMMLLFFVGQWRRHHGGKELILSCLVAIAVVGVHISLWNALPWTTHPLSLATGMGVGTLIWVAGLSPKTIAWLPPKFQKFYLDLFHVFPSWKGSFVSQQVRRQGVERIQELLEREEYTLLAESLSSLRPQDINQLDRDLMERLLSTPHPELRATAIRLLGQHDNIENAT